MWKRELWYLAAYIIATYLAAVAVAVQIGYFKWLTFSS